ncbi:MAG: hypothetical protein KDD44_14675, partial [Bdellovibrionales bacterium]|nr:hypothetical protein [Bdellovibrionales bacterium]
NGSDKEERQRVEAFLAACPFATRSSIIDVPGYFNFAALNNRAIEKGTAPYILLLNNDVEVTGARTLELLRAWCQFEDVGVVGGTLEYPDGSIQSAAINFSPRRPFNVHQPEHFCFVAREVNAVTFAMALTKRTVWETLGGLDEQHCPNGFGDALFCHQARRAGYRSLAVPDATGVHHESRSRGSMPEELELLEMDSLGLSISDLYADFHAQQQPHRVQLQAMQSPPVLELAGKILASRRWHQAANRIAQSLLNANRSRRLWAARLPARGR